MRRVAKIVPGVSLKGSCYHLCYLYPPRLFIAALWSPAGKGLTSWLLNVMFSFQCGILGQVWYLIVLIPDLCRLSYYVAVVLLLLLMMMMMMMLMMMLMMLMT